MKRTYLRWVPSILWMAVIYYFSSRTGNDLGGWLDGIRQWLPFMEGFDWGHFVSFGILAWTYFYGLDQGELRLRNKVFAVFLCILYGLTDEYHQSFVPGRSPDIMDLRNDAIGAAVGMLIVSIPAVSRIYRRL